MGKGRGLQMPRQRVKKTSRGVLSDIQRYKGAYDEVESGISLRRAAETHALDYGYLCRYVQEQDAFSNDNAAEVTHTPPPSS
ncbi:hypothetical protein JTB14_009552 [Gonioctena quinquepunctata]|nr:hypothetical protein JTB14_009552 [Gonioctena quinquepunctata]